MDSLGVNVEGGEGQQLVPTSLGNAEPHPMHTPLTPHSRQAHRQKFMPGKREGVGQSPLPNPRGRSSWKTLLQPPSCQPHFSETSQVTGRRSSKCSLLLAWSLVLRT